MAWWLIAGLLLAGCLPEAEGEECPEIGVVERVEVQTSSGFWGESAIYLIHLEGGAILAGRNPIVAIRPGDRVLDCGSDRGFPFQPRPRWKFRR